MKQLDEQFNKFKLSLFTEQLDVVIETADFLLNARGRKMKRVKARAGTGKTFSVGSFVKHINQVMPDNKQVAVCALTGRAAGQLASHGLDAKTIHSLLYTPVLDKDGNISHWSKNSPKDLRADFFAILVDEGSMIPRNILDDMVDIGIPILVMGDNAQVPAISNEQFNIMDDEPDVMDKYITHNDSILYTNRRTDPEFAGIFTVMKKILDGGSIPRICRERGVDFIKTKEVSSGSVFEEREFDIVLCGTNSMRRRINNKIRRIRGYDDIRPSVGEKIICMKNTVVNHVRINNGDIFTVEGRLDSDDRAIYMLKEAKVSVSILDETLITEKAPDNGAELKLSHFTYGYCISVHKSQGSTFDNVLFVDEDVSYFVDRSKFRYTAVSRAAKNLTIAR